MPATRAYKVTVNGYETTLLLSDADAKERGVYTEPKPAAEKKAPAPANKARGPRGSRKTTAKPAAAPVEDKAEDTGGPARDA